MTTVIFPRKWASDTNYTNGPAAATETKTDPGLALSSEGFVPGRAGAQHLNYVLHANTLIARRALTTAALALRSIWRAGLTPGDTDESMAAVQRNQTTEALAIKADAALLCSDWALIGQGGAMASVTSLITAAAMNPANGRVVAIGTGGNNCAFSTDNGGTWSAGGALGGVCGQIVYNTTHSVFMASRQSASALVRYGADGSAWSSGTTSLDDVSGGIAVLSTGRAVACGADGGVATRPMFSISDTGGSTWADATGTVPSAGSAAEVGNVVGNGGSAIYHVCRISGACHVSRSTDGHIWSNVAQLNSPNTSARPRILMCQNTGLLVVLAPVGAGAGVMAFASADGGTTWTDGMFYASAAIAGFGVAGGRLYGTFNSQIFASDGIDWT